MRIGEFAVKSGVSADTLRYYDTLGLLSPARVNRQRFYTEGDLRKAMAIQKLKGLNFHLEEIRRILELDEALETAMAQEIRDMDQATGGLALLQEKYVAILERERELREVKGQLEYLIVKVEEFLKGADIQ